MNFIFNTTPELICQAGGSSQCADTLQHLNGDSVLVITDKGITDLGLERTALESLRSGGYRVELFDGVIADPPEHIVKQAIECGVRINASAVVGIGGGSSLDTAKLVALMLGSDQSLNEVYGVDMATGPRLPLVLIPTTAGTGSEATAVAIVTTGESTKSGVVSKWLYPDVAILDADLTIGLPAHITAATGIDAMVHALEAFTSKVKKNPYSDFLALSALKILSTNISQAVHNGANTEARQHMLLGSYWAGQAFANAPVGAVHALAYPLGGRFHIPHGLSNSLVLPHVLRYNADACDDWYQCLAECLGIAPLRGQLAGYRLAHYFETLIAELGLPSKLRELGIEESQLDVLANDAMEQTRLLVNNPKEVTRQAAFDIYEAAF